MLIVIEVCAIVATAVLGYLWIQQPAGNYEPWTVICGVTLTVIELVRRTRDKDSHSPKRSRTSRLLHWIEENGAEKPLSTVLPKALDLAQQIQDRELEHWVRLESYGYYLENGMRAAEIVPEYRTVGGRYVDQFNNVFQPTDPEFSFLNTYRIRSGIGQLEELARRDDMQNIRDDDMISLFRQHLRWEPVRFCFSPVEVVEVLSQIRNRLLERLMIIARRAESAASEADQRRDAAELRPQPDGTADVAPRG
jgi:hypothetical protein